MTRLAEQVDGRDPTALKFHDESLMPVRMGDPYRVPDYAYRNWGLTYMGEEQADAAYRAEWEEGNELQLALVSRAITDAGYGDFPVLLQQTTGRVTGALLDRFDGARVEIADIGAGPGTSALPIYEQLPVHLKQSSMFLLIDPSPGALDKAGKSLTEKGIKFREEIGSDSDVLQRFPEGSFDVLTAVASIHHHARIPFDEYYRVLKPGGFLVIADWHQPLWEHPGSVRWFLEQMDWPERERGLANWDETYPNAIGAPDPMESLQSPLDRNAVLQITRFWKAYQRIAREANLGPNAIWPLEGHRPVGRYLQDMRRAGFELNSPDILRVINGGVLSANPHQILPDSSLLQLTIGQKI